VRFAICNELFEGWPFGRICRFVRGTGYEGLEVAPFTLGPAPTSLDAAARAALRTEARAAGVEIIGLHWLLARTQGLHLTSPNPDVRRATSDHLSALTQLCADLGGSIMVFGSPAQRSLLPGVSAADAFTYAADTFGALLRDLERCGVDLCIEPLTHDETDFLTSCDEALRLVDRLAHPRVRLHLDVKAMSSESVPLPDLIRRYAGRTGHFHANDPNRRGPGFGEVDFEPIFRALNEAGYNRWVSVEVFDFSPDPETIAGSSLAYMKECLHAVA
jgi:sugar phosphate isomerase/epimerase